MFDSFDSIRPAAVAGLFYPASATELREILNSYLAHAKSSLVAQHFSKHMLGSAQVSPKVIIVPHAGYIYSGLVAAHAYALIQSMAAFIKKVVLIGPAHTVYLQGGALPQNHYFETPLGKIAIDRDSVEMLAEHQLISVSDLPHLREHSLEVQLPFLQHCLNQFELIPMLIGECDPQRMTEVLEHLWGGEETLVVVSSDLSHFHQYDEAVRLDKMTCQNILKGQEMILPEQACGYSSLNAMFPQLMRHQLCLTQLSYQNSGDTAGDKNRVVGYASFATD
ncbi:AmmeMemoRadiSam system protein B [Shewanella sp. 125m-7]